MKKTIYSISILITAFLLSSCVRFGTMGSPSDRKSISKTENVSVNSVGGEINTSSHEFAPALTPDGKFVYFSRMTGFLELSIMRGEISGDKVVNVTKVDGTVNTEDQNFMGNVTADGKNLIMCRSHKFAMGTSQGGGMQDNMVQLNHGIFIYEITKSGYKFVEALDPFKGKLGDGAMPYVTYQAPYYAKDQKRVYFSCNPDKMGYGQWDLWYIEKTSSGWSEPVNLGANVNTKGDESTPFFTNSGKTLYFSSNGLPGIGDYDIYRSDFQNGAWGESELLGAPISSGSKDQGFVIAPDGKTAYFNSDRNGNNDIFKTTVPVKQIKQTTKAETNNFTGIVTDLKTGKAIASDIIVKNNETGESKNYNSGDDGKFAISIPAGKYSIWVQKQGYAFYSSNVNITDNSKKADKEIKLLPIESGSRLVLNNIVFDFDSDKLSPESETELDKVASVLLDNKGFNVEIQGHTDNQGSEDYNKKLSNRRAESVKAYLVKKGVDKKRMTAKGYGPTKPVDTNDTEEGRQNNRRVEILFK